MSVLDCMLVLSMRLLILTECPNPVIVDECIDCTCPEYALANPEECRIIVDECIDCTCPEYALANPEECRSNS
jgi:hypothetical protein